MVLNNYYVKYQGNYWGRGNQLKNNQGSPNKRQNTSTNKELIENKDTLLINDLPSLPKTQLNTVKIQRAQAVNQGNYIEFPPQHIDITPKITIPNGYRLMEDTSRYKRLISVDEHALRVIAEEEYQEAVITIPNTVRLAATFNAQVNLIKVSLVGQIFYNVVTTGWEAIDLMYGPNETIFNDEGSLAINYVMGYTTYETYRQQNPFLEYSVSAVPSEEYLITENGEKIMYSDPRFFQILQQGGNDITVFIPYTITISPSPTPIC